MVTICRCDRKIWAIPKKCLSSKGNVQKLQSVISFISTKYYSDPHTCGIQRRPTVRQLDLFYDSSLVCDCCRNLPLFQQLSPSRHQHFQWTDFTCMTNLSTTISDKDPHHFQNHNTIPQYFKNRSYYVFSLNIKPESLRLQWKAEWQTHLFLYTCRHFNHQTSDIINQISFFRLSVIW